MKKLVPSMVSVFLVVAGLLWVVPVFGQTTESASPAASTRESTASGTFFETASVNIGQDEMVDHDFFAASDSVTIAGTVYGDVVVFGGTIDISGHVTGDVIAAGVTVTISGPVDGNIRVAGMQVSVTSTVGKSAWIFGQTVTLSSAAEVGGSVLAAGETVTINGAAKTVTVTDTKYNKTGTANY